MEELVNLLEETIEILKKNGKSPEDVRWVGSKDGRFAISWDEFSKIADTVYDVGYGSAQVAEDLVVVGYDWWLERAEYDGAEWWEFKQLPTKRQDAKPFKVVIGDLWPTLSDLNKGDGKKC